MFVFLSYGNASFSYEETEILSFLEQISSTNLIFIFPYNLVFLFCNFFTGTPKKKPRTSKERVPQPKNTVAMLNELRHGLVYKLESQTGPVHAPLFTISVEVSTKLLYFLNFTEGKYIQRDENNVDVEIIL